MSYIFEFVRGRFSFVHQSAKSSKPPNVPIEVEIPDDDDEIEPPHPLSEDKVRQLSEECDERFVKLKVKYITDKEVMI